MFSSRTLLALAVVLTLATPLAGASAQTPTSAEPAAVSFPLGDFRATSLRDQTTLWKNDRFVWGKDTDPAEAAKVLTAHGAPGETLTFNAGALLVRTPDRLVLIDAGRGPRSKGLLLQSLAKAGVTPDQITDILITHSHFDHVGGLVDLDGHSVFAKATIRMSNNEWVFLQSQGGAKTMVAAISPQVKPFEPGQPVFPGITPVALYGHTPGHVGYEITSHGRTLLVLGDTAHSSIVSLARPAWPIGFDNDRPTGVRQRVAELKRVADAHTLIFAGHFPFPSVGYIVPDGDGYAFKPDVPVK